MTRPVAVSGDAVEVRLVVSGRAHLIYIFNHAAGPATAAIRLRIPLQGRSVRDLVSGQAVSVNPLADGFEWRESLPARDARVLVVGEDVSRATR